MVREGGVGVGGGGLVLWEAMPRTLNEPEKLRAREDEVEDLR